jgi:hypothetical protein
MKFKYSVLMAALAASLFGVPAFAQTATSGSAATASGVGTGIGIGGGNAVSNTTSGSTSSSMSSGGEGLGIGQGGRGGRGGNGGNASGSATINFNDPAVAGGAAGDSGGDPNFTQRLITTGTAIAPSIYSNNVCALSASAAGGFLGGAFALGFDRVDKGCDARAFASLLGHFAEINSIAATHAADPQVRALAERAAVAYAQWANNYLCMMNPEMAASAPPGSNLCQTVATQQGLQVVPAPVPVAMGPPPRPIVMADPPPKPPVPIGPHVYGTYEVVPTSHHTGPISGYDGPDYQDD